MGPVAGSLTEASAEDRALTDRAMPDAELEALLDLFDELKVDHLEEGTDRPAGPKLLLCIEPDTDRGHRQLLGQELGQPAAAGGDQIDRPGILPERIPAIPRPARASHRLPPVDIDRISIAPVARVEGQRSRQRTEGVPYGERVRLVRAQGIDQPDGPPQVVLRAPQRSRRPGPEEVLPQPLRGRAEPAAAPGPGIPPARAEWRPETRAAWRAFWRSEMAAVAAAVDLPALEGELGLTPAARQRMGIRLVQPVRQPTAAPETKASRYAHLREVAS